MLPTAVVDADTANLPLGYEICFGDSLVLPAKVISTGAPTTIRWTSGETLSDSSIVRPIAKPTETTMYYLYATVGGCTTMDSVLVRVLPGIFPVISADTNTICQGGFVTLSVSAGIGAATYLWEPAASLNRNDSTTVLAAPTQTTTYTVTVFEGGCSGQATFVVNVLGTPSVNYRVSGTQECGSLTVSFENLSQNGTLMRWDFGDGSPVSNEFHPTHTYTTPGNYTVSLTTTSLSACPETRVHTEVISVSEPFQARMSLNTTLNRDFILPDQNEISFKDSSNGAVRWLWNFGDGYTSSEVNTTHRFETAGTYFPMLIVENALGCVDTAIVGPVKVLEPTLNIPNVFTPNGDGVNDVFRVEYFGTKSFTTEVFDRWGNRMFITNNTTEFWDGRFNSSLVPEGVYYYVVKIGDKIYNGNVTVVR